MANERLGREVYESLIQQRRLFALGAGFSAAAGIPMTRELLVSSMKRFGLECPGIFARVEAMVRTCFELDDSSIDYAVLCRSPDTLSQLCTFLHYHELREFGGGERWTRAGSQENLALRFYLAKEIALSTPSSENLPALYLDFATQLHLGDVVLSFNWDTLLELALGAVGVPYSYKVEDGRVTLAKLHGSINWRLGSPDAPSPHWNSFRFTENMMDEELYWTRALVRPESWRHVPPPFSEVQPFIILPGFGKALDVRYLAELWYRPEFAFQSTHDIFVIGLSLAPDDFIIRSLFLDNLPYEHDYSGVPGRKVAIIDPDAAAGDRFSFLSRTPNVEFICERFSPAHLERMKSR